MGDYNGIFERALADSPPLSAAGAARRAAMCSDLSGVVVRRRRRRVATRWSGTLALALFALLFVRDPGVNNFVAPSPASDGAAVIEFAEVRDDPSVMERYLSPGAPLAQETWIDDGELLDLLESAQRHTGLIRSAGKVSLTHDVVDDLVE